MKIGLIVGSLRKESWNRKVAEVVRGFFPEDVEAELIDITNVPLYNEDLDGETVHEAYTALRKDVQQCDAYIFFTPEYNRTFAPAAKNVIDICSVDPEGNAWAKKPVAIFSASIGGYGGMAANHALRQSFIFVDAILMQQPEVYLSSVHTMFDEQGKMADDKQAFLKQAVQAFMEYIKSIHSV